MVRMLSFVFTVFFFLQSCAAASDEKVFPSLTEVADAITGHYEDHLEELKPVYRGHWTLRLYRISGDPRYLEDLKVYGDYLYNDYSRFVAGLHDEAFRSLTHEVLLGPIRKAATEKSVMRRQVLDEAGDYLYMHQLLYLTFMIHSLGLDKRDMGLFDKALAALKRFSFSSYLEQPGLLRYHAAEMSNAVYYLQVLGLGRFDKEYVKRFRRVHRTTEQEGDPVLYENKIYGMTHLMIAASEYYQKRVSAQKFRWILDYFDRNIDAILARSKPDVVAEVGLCFLLAGKADHPVVIKTRNFVSRSWNPDFKMIPSVAGRADLNQGEHRNVLAVMLLRGLENLYSGPDLGAGDTV